MVYGESLQQTRDSVGSEPNVYPIPIRYNSKIKEYQTIVIYKNQIESGVLYWDNDSQGTWDDYDWGDDSDYEPSQSDVQYVLNQNNKFIDTYDTQDFINTTSSTGTHSTGSYTLQVGDELISNYICKDNITVTNIYLEVDSTDNDYIKIYVSDDGGSNWTEITNNSNNSISLNASNGIIYKIENVSGSGSGFPTAWGTWGSLTGGGDITINKTLVVYSE